MTDITKKLTAYADLLGSLVMQCSALQADFLEMLDDLEADAVRDERQQALPMRELVS